MVRMPVIALTTTYGPERLKAAQAVARTLGEISVRTVYGTLQVTVGSSIQTG
jgi:hypothetical protein